MADQDLRIKVSAETGAAQDALNKLADEMKGVTTAAEGAGSETQKLARQTADATAKVQAARDAVERAKRAQSEAAAVTQAFGKESAEAADAQRRLAAAEEAATKATREAERALEGTAKAVSAAGESADKKAEPALRRMNDALQKAGKEADRTASELRTLDARIEATSKGASGLSATFANFKGNLAATAVSSLAGYLKDAGLYALDTAANFERMKTALTTTLGSTEAANAEFERLQGFAAATPFSLEEVTDGFIKLKNRGLDAGERAMRAYGDTAGAMGKTLDDVVEAVADATQGEGERLKEFGINMHKQGDQVALTFRGVTQTVKFEAKAIEDYLIHLGETNFAGGMEAQSRTLGGMWSTLKDGVAQFAVAVMDSGITDGLKSIMSALGGLGETGQLLASLIGGPLGLAFEALGVTLHAVIPLVDLFAKGFNLLLSPVGMAKDAIEAFAGSVADDLAKPIEEAVAAQRKAREEATALANATPATNRYVVAAIEYTGALLQQAEAHMAAADAAKAHEQAEERYLAKLAKEEQKLADEQFEASMFVGPMPAPGFKRPDEKAGKRARKQANSRALRQEEFNTSVAAFEFETQQQVRTGNAEAFEQEIALREQALTGMDREIEILETLGVVHEEMIRKRLDAEIELARWRQENAQTEEQRAEADIALTEAQHRKHMHAAKKRAAEEKALGEKREKDHEKEMKAREKITEQVAGAVTTLGEGMVSAFNAMAEGEKGAVARMLSEVLKGVAQKHAVLALAEFAMAAGSAASYNFPAAAAHTAAGGMHTAVATAAGAGAVVAGKIWEGRRGDGGGGGGSGRPSPFAPSGGASGSDPGATDSEGLQAQEVPISHEQLRRQNGSVRPSAMMQGPAVQISGTVNLYGAGGKAEFIEDIRRAIDRSDRGGRRARI